MQEPRMLELMKQRLKVIEHKAEYLKYAHLLSSSVLLSSLMLITQSFYKYATKPYPAQESVPATQQENVPPNTQTNMPVTQIAASIIYIICCIGTYVIYGIVHSKHDKRQAEINRYKKIIADFDVNYGALNASQLESRNRDIDTVDRALSNEIKKRIEHSELVRPQIFLFNHCLAHTFGNEAALLSMVGCAAVEIADLAVEAKHIHIKPL